MEHPPFKVLTLTPESTAQKGSTRGTVPDGQFEWGARLLKGNGGAHKVG